MLCVLNALNDLGGEGRGLIDDAFVIGASTFDDRCWRHASLVVSGMG